MAAAPLAAALQAEMAARLGMTTGGYSHYERGFRRVPLSSIPDLARALDCPEDELLGFEAPRGKRGPPSGWERRVEAIRKLPRKKQREIQNVVDALLANAG